MTSSVAGPRSSSKALHKAKVASEKGHGHCWVVSCPSDPRSLSGSPQNHYNGEVRSANQWDAPKTTAPAASTGQLKGPNSSWQHLTARRTTNTVFKSWTNWATKLCLIHHIHLTSRQTTTSFSSISTTFCRENTFTTSRRQKMLSKSLLNPKAWIFMLQE